jgi:L-threonylcarbamoyladenylate synthase
MNLWHLQQATRYLKNGGIIAYPTEAIYGLGCDPLNEAAVARLLCLKQRPWQKGLILIAADYAALEIFLEPLTPVLQQRVFPTWPGPVTWLLPARASVPLGLRGQSSQLAVRVTAHPQVVALCTHWGGAIVSTSANRSGRPAAKTALQVRRIFGSHIDYIVSGQVGGRLRPSEIREALTNTVLRA